MDQEEPGRESIFEENNPPEGGLAEISFDLTEEGRWLLKVIAGPNNGAEFSMQVGHTYTLGTDPAHSDIIFHDTSVSRQHARITISEDNILTIEDLNSRNGTYINGERLTEKQNLPLSTPILMGTSSFVVYDRESDMKTIISPLLPSIVKALQKEESEEEKEEARPAEAPIPAPPPARAAPPVGAFIIIAILTGLFVTVGIGISTLFKSEPIQVEEYYNIEQSLKDALLPYSDIRYTFNKTNGRLFLVGHVLTNADKTQLLNELHNLTFIKSIDDTGVVIDEFAWREINQIIARNPAWKNVSIHAPSAGHFILSGYLQTREQADRLWDYVSSNFPYISLLEKRLIVEEDVINRVNSLLKKAGYRDVLAEFSDGDLTLAGSIPQGKKTEFQTLVEELKKIDGIRLVRDHVVEIAPAQAMIDISDKYSVTGYSQYGEGNVNVVINGRILSVGDRLDGMKIIEIGPRTIILEKDSVKYRINYNK